MFWLVVGGAALLAAPHLRRDARWLRATLIWFALICMVRYGWWRVTATLPPVEFGLGAVYGYLLCAIELLGLYATYMVYRGLGGTTDWTRTVDANLGWHGDSPPRIHVLIATYNEPWSVLERTCVGAAVQNYDNYKVWLLDDGNRPWLAEKAAELGIGYVTRANNVHFKAGNINNALLHIRSQDTCDFFAIVDADFVLNPAFLQRTLALMVDESIGLVQTPQFFYNPDPFQKVFGGVGSWPDEQRSWLDFMEPALDATDSATCCGTSCLVRDAALRKIGDFPTDSISEDTLCSIKLREAGYKTRYLSEKLSVGLAAESVGEFINQRARWLVGGLQNANVVWRARGARGEQTLKATFEHWIVLWRMPIYAASVIGWTFAPVLYFLTGELVMRAELLEIVAFVLPLWLERFFMGWLTRGRRAYFVSDTIWRVLMFMWLRSTAQYLLLGTVARFKVTDKAINRQQALVNWRLIYWLLVPALLLLAGLVYNTIDPTSPARAGGFLLISLFSTGHFLAVLVAAIFVCIESPQRRTDDRYDTSEGVAVSALGEDRVWQCMNISVGGALFAVGNEQPPERVVLDISGVGPTEAVLVRRQGLAAAYAFSDSANRPALIEKIYCSNRYVPLPDAWSLSDALAGFARRLLT